MWSHTHYITLPKKDTLSKMVYFTPHWRGGLIGYVAPGSFKFYNLLGDWILSVNNVLSQACPKFVTAFYKGLNRLQFMFDKRENSSSIWTVNNIWKIPTVLPFHIWLFRPRKIIYMALTLGQSWVILQIVHFSLIRWKTLASPQVSF